MNLISDFKNSGHKYRNNYSLLLTLLYCGFFG